MTFTRRSFGVGALGAGAIAAIAPNALALGASPWLRAETPRFIIYSNGPETRLREIAHDLESFDAWLGRLTNAGPSNSPLKLEVFIFRGPDLFYEALARRDTDIAGFYFAEPELVASTAFFHDNEGLDAQTVLFHEYAHHYMFAHFANAYPAWYIEGFAEFVSTMSFERDRVVVGRAAGVRVAWLVDGHWKPMDWLLTTDPNSLNDEDTARFYAQSWLFTHYLSLTPGKIELFRNYILQWRQGADPVATFQATFGRTVDQMQTDLHAYYNAGPHALGYNRPAAVEHSEAQVTTMPDSAGSLIALWSRARRYVPEDSRASFAATVRQRVAAAPQDRFSQMLLARVEATSGDHQAARALLDTYLAAHADDVEATFLMGLSYFNDAQDAGGDAAIAALAHARHYFVAANRLDQNYVPALYRYAASFNGVSMSNEQMANTTNVALLAHEIAPQVSQIGFLAAQWLMSQDRAGEAVPILRAIAYDPHGGEGATQALDLLHQAEAAAQHTPAAAQH